MKYDVRNYINNQYIRYVCINYTFIRNQHFSYKKYFKKNQMISFTITNILLPVNNL